MIDLSTMFPKIIPNFLPNVDGEAGVALRAVSKNRGRQIFTTFVFAQTHNLAYWEEGVQEADNHVLSDVLPRCNSIQLTTSRQNLCN